MIIPDNYRLLKDEEIIPEDCRCFGTLENKTTGWGLPPKHLIGQVFCDGAAFHPDLIAVKRT